MESKFKLLGLLSATAVGLFIMNSCVSLPEGIEPVKNFEKEKYLGKWYEIARLDHRFERDLSQVTAEYSNNEDGGIKVVNRGYNDKKKEWSDAVGKAYFVKDASTGHLKVSFFGPFYGSYVIFELDKKDYQYAYITSNKKDYLWFLSRTPSVSAVERERFLSRAKELDFDVGEIIFVDHSEKEE